MFNFNDRAIPYGVKPIITNLSPPASSADLPDYAGPAWKQTVDAMSAPTVVPANTGVKAAVAAAINPRWNPSMAQIAQDGALPPQAAAAASPGMPAGVRQVNLPYDAESMSVGLDENGNTVKIAPAPIYATTDKNGNPAFSNVGAADAAFLRDGINSGARTGMGRRGMGGTFYDGNAPSDSDMAANASLDALNAAHGGGTVRPLNYFGRSYTSELPAGQRSMSYNDAKAWEDKNGGAAAGENAARADQVLRNRMMEVAFQKKLQMLPQNYADAVKGQATQMQGQAGLNSSFARLMEAQHAVDPATNVFNAEHAKTGDVGASSAAAAAINPSSPYAGPAATAAEQYLAGQTHGALSFLGFKPQFSPEEIADPNTIVNVGPSLTHGGQAVTLTRPGKGGKPQSDTYSLDGLPPYVQQYLMQRAQMQRALAGGMGRR